MKHIIFKTVPEVDDVCSGHDCKHLVTVVM